MLATTAAASHIHCGVHSMRPFTALWHIANLCELDLLLSFHIYDVHARSSSVVIAYLTRYRHCS